MMSSLVQFRVVGFGILLQEMYVECVNSFCFLSRAGG